MVCEKEAQLTADWIIRISSRICIKHTASHLGIGVVHYHFSFDSFLWVDV